MKKAIFLIIMLALISVAQGDDTDIFYADHLEMDVVLTSGYTLSPESDDARVESVDARFRFYPKEGYGLEILSLETKPQGVISGDDILFSWDNPSFGEHSFTIEGVIRTRNRPVEVSDKVSFPLGELDEELLIYIEETEKIDITPEIIQQASEIAEGQDDLYSVVFRLASWSNENIDYSLTTATTEASQKASWVLENRYGVCDEITNLFIAMCRSIGIPARFVSGISYTNSELFDDEWGLHGWAEVYFPGYGWVSFDPTYGQLGYVDAGHIKLEDSTDSDKSSTRFEWRSTETTLDSGRLSLDVDIIDSGRKAEAKADIRIKPISDKVKFGSYNLIEVSVKNRHPYYNSVEIDLAKPEEITIIDPPEKFILLKPYEERKAYWIVKVDDSLSKNYIYTFPIEAVSSDGYSAEGEFKADSSSVMHTYGQMYDLREQFEEKELKSYTKNIDISCQYPKAIYAGDEMDISCTIENKGNAYLKNIDACLDKDCRTIDLGISQEENVFFTKSFDTIGEKEISLIAKNPDVNAIEMLHFIVEDYPKAGFFEFEYPKEARYSAGQDQDMNISLQIMKISESSLRNATITISFNGKETSWTLEEIDSNQGFTVAIENSLLIPGENKISYSLIYHDRDLKSYLLEEENIMIVIPDTFADRLMLWLNYISLKLDILFSGIKAKV